MSKKWFFKRGNARVSWKTAPKEARWFAVDENGRGDWWERKPEQDKPLALWRGNCYISQACHVGHKCPDWRNLLFERPQPEPPKPVITAEEWAAIRVVFPGVRAIAKDSDGNIWAFMNTPLLGVHNWHGGVNAYLSHFFLRARFADIPWDKSLVEYPGDC